MIKTAADALAIRIESLLSVFRVTTIVLVSAELLTPNKTPAGNMKLHADIVGRSEFIAKTFHFCKATTLRLLLSMVLIHFLAVDSH